MEWVFIDDNHIKAHQHSSGANSKDQAIAKSHGGNTTKIHLAVDAHGNPITFIITDGTTHDIKMAKDLVDKVDLSNVVMLSTDKGYDSQDFRAYVEEKNACKHSTKIKYSRRIEKVLRRWLALPYYLYCLRLAALYYFFTSPTIVSNPMTIWTGIYISFGI